ncbi:UNVERIFIED_CONTAM: hypothetical protein K2H54_031453 [Gekko kuhli]
MEEVAHLNLMDLRLSIKAPCSHLRGWEPIPASGTTPGDTPPPFLEAAWPPRRPRCQLPGRGDTSDDDPPRVHNTRCGHLPQKSPARTLHHNNPLSAAPEKLAQLPTHVPAEALALLGVAEVLAQPVEPTRAVLCWLLDAHADMLAHPATGTPPVLSRLEATAMYRLAQPKAPQLEMPAVASKTHKGGMRSSDV